MSPEIPTQFQFEELLADTFPGIFSAITLFMLLDIWSPIGLTSWVTGNTTNLLIFVGFIISFGTILGVIIDGIHHSIIEKILETFTEIREIEESINALYPSDDLKLETHYFFNKMGEKALDVHKYLIKARYRYSEFYANVFIAVVPFSFVIPFYLFEVLQVSWAISLFFGMSLFIVACGCLFSSYTSLKKYNAARFSVICGYLNYKTRINLKAHLFSWDDIPGNDSVRLIDFLKKNFDIDWIKEENIKKSDDNKTISVSIEKNYLSLILNDEKTKANLIINGEPSDQAYIAEMINGKRNIFAEKNVIFKKYCTIVATVSDNMSKIPSTLRLKFTYN